MSGIHISNGRARAINAYAKFVKHGQPIPLNLIARLDALGVDIAILEARYGG